LTDEPLQRQRGLRRIAGRVGRHVGWARRQGVGRLVEEDQLDPIDRIATSIRKARWRRHHRVAGTATPVFVVGVQRSGTNMLVRGLERAPSFEVRNENDDAAFHRFLLRDDATIRALVQRSGHEYVLFKPLCDSHRIAELLDRLGTTSAGRAIWAFRDVDGRVRSAVAKFGGEGLRALREVAEGKADVWQAGGLSDERLRQLRSFDLEHFSHESAAALFWFLRNSLYFDLGLDRRDDVLLASYGRFVEDPDASMRRICDFVDVDYEPEMVAHVDARAASTSRVEIDPEVRRLCDGLTARLEAAIAAADPRPSSRSAG
jgi:hypothetical protein